MATFDAFTFLDSDALDRPNDSFVAIVPRRITDSKQLLNVLNERLKLPEYFGFNWNALEECLRDFHWIKQRKIVLIHEDLPALPASDVASYVDVLNESVRYWKSDKAHQFVVVFPKSCRETVERMADGVK